MALADQIEPRMGLHRQDGDVVLGDDFVAPDRVGSRDVEARRQRRGLWSALKRSALTRKIITFNLVALNILVAGILYLNSSSDELSTQRQDGLLREARAIASVFEVQLPAGAPVSFATGDGVSISETLAALDLGRDETLVVYDLQGQPVGSVKGTRATEPGIEPGPTFLTDALNTVWGWVSRAGPVEGTNQTATDQILEDAIARALDGQEPLLQFSAADGPAFGAAVPIEQAGKAVGALALTNTSGDLQVLIRSERERVLQMFLIATLVSIGLSLILASTIANPLADLAAAAEIGRDRDKLKSGAGRIRIPDLTARPDEIGRLSGALRGMVAALYHRIDSNEQFAADVAHEIKNPLASLRSAVGTMHVAKREDQRTKLLDVIEHDVRRLDRLVSDISNASRLDSELVRETQEEFDLLHMLRNLSEYLGEEAGKKGIEFIVDFPSEPIRITGLEARLAQVFVNLITNAISFCEDGDAIRIWARMRDDRVLAVVEDTGPGIPDQALTKIFKRFYSHREAHDFGNNSGLGLAISKQIVEAHDGVIWAENIRPTDADLTSDPLGARFVVGLPV